MQYIEAVNELRPENKNTLFLAGGITNCPDWQADLVRELEDEDVTIYNPRRENFPIEDPNASEEQIAWEHDKLHKAQTVCFWFCKETLCPIVLYEMGAALERDQKLVIGVDPDYKRIQDVEIQSKLQRPDIKVHKGFDKFKKALKNQVKQADKKRKVYVGVVGYSSRNFDKKVATALLAASFKTIEDLKGMDNQYVCVTGLTKLGVPFLAYKMAEKFGWSTMGIACEKAFDYPVWPVEEEIIVGEDWGDESKTFIDKIDVLIRIGGGEQSFEEVQMAKEKKIPVYEYDLPESK